MEKTRTNYEGNLGIMIHMSAWQAAFRPVQRGVMEGFSITDMDHTPKRGIQSHAAVALQRNPNFEDFIFFIINATLLCKLRIPDERMVLRLVDHLIGRGAS